MALFIANLMGNHQKVEKWAKWLRVIHAEVSVLAESAAIYSEIRQVVIDNPRINKSNQFYEWMTKNYVDTTLIRIRRLLDRDKNTVSLSNLLSEMRENLHFLSRERHLSLYLEGMRSTGEAIFDELAGKDVNGFPVKQLREDLDCLEQIRAVHGRYTDKRIAHYDKTKGVEPLGTFQDFDEAVACFEEILKRYNLLLTAHLIPSLYVLRPSWKEIFKEVWIPPADSR
ncbi:MAG TPA: hypothetical protein IGS53_01260 [Leptolyngbyaceae cyanobacterium M33_DOE_097]|uniref:HEPN AbiU2-like domain-containing protein n=1 Tax=Oscillatoriales cyanobacterium SpSt-418 TaxID=2282169 RepID=A0A7C3PFT9_9CYAN|nr:hypothetical protein [Leptolyngbyaceae cyanobacterium M33_DOE_097]